MAERSCNGFECVYVPMWEASSALHPQLHPSVTDSERRDHSCHTVAQSVCRSNGARVYDDSSLPSL